MCFTSLLPSHLIQISSSHCFLCSFSNLGVGASVFRLQNQDDTVSEDDVHESNEPEPPHRKNRTWRPTKDRQQPRDNDNKVKPKKKKDKEGNNVAKTEAIQEPSVVIHQHMLSTPHCNPKHSSVSRHKNRFAGTSTVVNPGQDNMGIIHQDMLRKSVQQDSQGN